MNPLEWAAPRFLVHLKWESARKNVKYVNVHFL